MTTETATTPKAGRRAWLGLFALALPTLLLSLDLSVLYLALPVLSSDLGADSTQQLWILDSYSFLLAGFLVTMGTLGDRIGRRKLLMIGAIAFAVVSVIAAFSVSAEMLIVARALLGIAGATVMPSTMALIRNMFEDPKEMALAIGIWYACFMGGMAIGPLVGGVLLEFFWWGAAFLMGVPVMIILLVVGPFLLPEYRAPQAGKLDLTSVALSLATILPAVYGLKATAQHGPSTTALLALVAAVAFGVVFVRRQRRLTNPLLDLKLFANVQVSTGLAVMLLVGVAMAGISLVSVLYMQTVAGLSPMQAGLWLVPQNVVMIIGMLIAPLLGRRFRPSTVVLAGLIICASGFAVHSQIETGGPLPVAIGLILASAGVSLPMSAITNVVMSSAPPEQAGAVSSLSETGGEFGVAVGIATMGSLATAVYRMVLGETMPAGLASDAAGRATEGITEATTVVTELPQQLGSELLDAARAAFTIALNAVGIAGAVILVALAIISHMVLRRHEAATAEPAERTERADSGEPALAV